MEKTERYSRTKSSNKVGRIAVPGKTGLSSGDASAEYREGKSVELVIGKSTEIGYTALIDGSREGLLYRNEVFQKLRKGQRMAGFVKKVREDGKIDLCLQKPGCEKVYGLSERILDALRERGGFLPVTDKSGPEIIYGMFGASKKTYKKAIGALYKKRLIQIGSDGITLLQP